MTAHGKRSTHSMRVLGRPYIGIRYAKRLLRREFYGPVIGEGSGRLRLSRCRQRRAGRVVRCLAGGMAFDAPLREIHSIELGRDGVLQYRQRSRRGRMLWSYAITP